jgi:archaellum component FlaC
VYLPTHEERIVALENAAKASREFQQQVIRKIHEMQENTTMLLGAAHGQGIDIKHIKRRLDGIDTRLEGMDMRFDGIEMRLDGMDMRMDRMEVMLSQILERLPEKA